jgi:hypothetical protein
MRSIIKSWFNQYTAHGKFWLSLALVALVVDAAISYRYGVTLTWLHGIGFALVAVFFSLLPDQAYSEFEAKRFGSGIAMAVLCVPLGTVAYYSHLGYGAGVRVGSIQQASVHNAKFDDARSSLESDRTNIAMWREHLAKLQAENAWVATVSADGLKSQVAAADLSIAQEKARGGCGPKCLKLTKDKADLENRIAIAEQATKLTGQIEATQRIIDEKTQTAAAATFESSPVVNQTNVAAQLYLAASGEAPEVAIKPDAVTTTFMNIFVTGGGSLAFMIMAPLGFFAAGRYRRSEAVDVSGLSALTANMGTVTAGSLRGRDDFQSPADAPTAPLQPYGDVHYHEGKDPRVDRLAQSLKNAKSLLQLAHEEGRLRTA